MSHFGDSVPGSLSGWSAIGESGLRTVTSTEGFILLAKDTAASVDDLSAYVRTPDDAVENSITAAMACILGEATTGGDASEVGICLYDSTAGKYVTLGVRLNSTSFPLNTMRAVRNSSTSGETFNESEYFLNASPLVWLRIDWEDTGSALNVRTFVSIDGDKWAEMDDVANYASTSGFNDVDKVGMYVVNSNSQAAPIVTGQFYHFEETGPIA